MTYDGTANGLIDRNIVIHPSILGRRMGEAWIRILIAGSEHVCVILGVRYVIIDNRMVMFVDFDPTAACFQASQYEVACHGAVVPRS